MSYVGTSRYVGNESDKRELEAWCELMCVTMMSAEEYNAVRTDAGVAYFGFVDVELYLLKASQFVAVAQELKLRGNRFRMLDQKLWTLWNRKHHGRSFPSNVYKIFTTSTPPKKVPNHTFMHYAVGQHKPKYMDWLEKHAPQDS
jgi:hypothetical protein